MTKSKTKAGLKQVQDSELAEMFQQMMDPSQVDPEVVYPKYKDMKMKVNQIAQFLKAIDGTPISQMYEIGEFTQKADELLEDLKQHQYEKDSLKDNYAKFKDGKAIQECIMICAALSDYKADLADKNKLSDRFIKNMTMGTRIMKFSNMDLSIIWNNPEVPNDVKQYIIKWLHLMYKTALEIYQISSSPDIDIDKFSEVIMNALDQVSKQPELHRCTKAFAKIRSSVGLMKNNFGDYYKDFVQSRNPSTLIESFIVDVSSSQDTDATTARQFRQIISYFNKTSAQSNMKNDPRMKVLFDTMNANLTKLEKSHKSQPADEPDAQ